MKCMIISICVFFHAWGMHEAIWVLIFRVEKNRCTVIKIIYGHIWSLNWDVVIKM